MAQINMSSIMDKVREYHKSTDGKKRTDEFVQNKRESNDGKLASGDYILTIRDMCRFAEDLIQMLKREASSSALPQSVLDHFESLTYTQPSPVGGNKKKYKIDILFQDDLSRMSLLITSGSRRGERTGEGVKNIVSLFDTGYQTSGHVYGEWTGRVNGDIASRTELEGKYFIERAIESFNRQYSSQYQLEARVTASQEFYSSFNY